MMMVVLGLVLIDITKMFASVDINRLLTTALHNLSLL